MRLFIAIELPEEVKDYLIELQKQFTDIKAKFVRKEQMHLTLKFLGETEKLDEIKEKLSEVKTEPFETALSELGVFPSENYVRVLWVGLKNSEKIIELQKKIDSSLSEIGFARDKRFHSHVTLARIKFIQDKPGFVKKLKETKVEEKGFKVEKVYLIKSTLTREGPVYETLGEF